MKMITTPRSNIPHAEKDFQAELFELMKKGYNVLLHGNNKFHPDNDATTIAYIWIGHTLSPEGDWVETGRWHELVDCDEEEFVTGHQKSRKICLEAKLYGDDLRVTVRTARYEVHRDYSGDEDAGSIDWFFQKWDEVLEMDNCDTCCKIKPSRLQELVAHSVERLMTASINSNGNIKVPYKYGPNSINHDIYFIRDGVVYYRH